MGRSLNKDLQCYHLLEGCEKGVFVVLKTTVFKSVLGTDYGKQKQQVIEYFLRLAIWNVALLSLDQAAEVCWFQISLTPFEVEHWRSVMSVCRVDIAIVLLMNFSAENNATGKEKNASPRHLELICEL